MNTLEWVKSNAMKTLILLSWKFIISDCLKRMLEAGAGILIKDILIEEDDEAGKFLNIDILSACNAAFLPY